MKFIYKQKNFIGPAFVGIIFFFLCVWGSSVGSALVSHKFGTSCDNPCFKRRWIEVYPMLYMRAPSFLSQVEVYLLNNKEMYH
jgi:hypothetical protein